MNQPLLGRSGALASDPAVERAVAPAVDPRSAGRGSERRPIARRTADRGACDSPTYPHHQEVLP